MPAYAHGWRQRLPPGTSGLRRRGSPRAAREGQALRSPSWPRAPIPPFPPPPALPWLQPGQGRLSLDSAGGTRGRSCAPTSPHHGPPPSAPSVDRPGAGLGGRGGASQPQAGSAPPWSGQGREGARWTGAEPCSPGSPEAPGAKRRSEQCRTVTWRFLTQLLKSDLLGHRIASPSEFEPDPKEKERAHLASPGDAFGRKGGLPYELERSH